MANKGFLRVIVENFLLSNVPPLMWANMIKHVAEEFEQETASDYAEFLNYLINIPKYPGPVKKALQFTISGKHQGGAAVLIGAAVGAVIAIIVGIVSPFFSIGQYATQRIAQTFRFPLDLGMAAYFRYPNQQKLIMEHFADQGISNEALPLITDLFRRRVSEIDLAKLYFRTPERKELVKKELADRGFQPTDVQMLLEMVKAYPGLSDLISWSVRDAFSPDTVRKFQLDQDFPPIFREEAGKLGLDNRFIDASWAAHWQLPGVVQAFQMLHRLRPGTTDKPFTESDLELLLRVADVAPYFRDRLVQISYEPYTRVDIRRMYGLGILDLKGVYNAHLDLGYDKNRAATLTEFVVQDAKAETRDLSKEIIIEAYRDSLFTAQETTDRLKDLGYLAEDIKVLLEIEDYRRKKAELGLVLDRLELQFTEGEITPAQVYSQLGPFNLNNEYIDTLVRTWTLKRDRKVALPSLTDLEKLYERNIINLIDFRNQLALKGYSPDKIDWLIKLLEEEIQERAADKAEKMRKEQARLRTSDVTRQHQQDVADLNVEIAEIELQIANLKVGRTGLLDPVEKGEIDGQIAEMQVAKEQVQLEIARLNLDFRSDLNQ